jgi:hypothetical protein
VFPEKARTNKKFKFAKTSEEMHKMSQVVDGNGAGLAFIHIFDAFCFLLADQIAS